MKFPSLLLGLSVSSMLFGADDIGRFQLVSANVITDGQPTPHLFKIDTATGQVYRFIELRVAELPEGKHLDAAGFMKVNNDINEAINDAKEALPAFKRAIESGAAPKP